MVPFIHVVKHLSREHVVRMILLIPRTRALLLGTALDRLILDVSLNLDHGHFDPYTANPRVLVAAIALAQHFRNQFSSLLWSP